MTERSTMRITSDDLLDPRVEGYLEEQAVINRNAPDIPQQSLFARIVYSSYFYLGVAGMLGALLGWAILEPFFEDNVVSEDKIDPAHLLMFPTVAACIGLLLGSAEGIICRNFMRALLCAAVGAAVGFIGGLLALIPTGIVFSIMATMAVRAGNMQPGEDMPHGFGLFLLIAGRSMAWSLAAIPSGMGQGLALREKKV